MAGPIIFRKEPEENHRRYLKEFFQEEFDTPNPLESTQSRDRVPRRKIRAYVARTYNAGISESDIVKVTATIESTFSGYVHGAAVHTLDAYDGRSFRVPMSPGDSPLEVVRRQTAYYAFRTMGAIGTAAKAMGDEELFERLYNLGKELFDDEGEARAADT